MCSNPLVKAVIPESPTSSPGSLHGDAERPTKSSKLHLLARVSGIVLSLFFISFEWFLQGQGTDCSDGTGASAYIRNPIPSGGSSVFQLKLELLNSRCENDGGWSLEVKATGKHPPYNILFGYRSHNIDNQPFLFTSTVNEKAETF